MSGQEESTTTTSAAASSLEPWTCDACGCRTNTEADNPLTCSTCGTSRRGPSWLLEAHGNNRSSARLMMHLGLFGIRPNRRSAEEEDFEEDVNYLDDEEEDFEEEDDFDEDNHDDSVGEMFVLDRTTGLLMNHGQDDSTLDLDFSEALDVARVADTAIAVSTLPLRRRNESIVNRSEGRITGRQNSTVRETSPRRSPRFSINRNINSVESTTTLMNLAVQNSEDFVPFWISEQIASSDGARVGTADNLFPVMTNTTNVFPWEEQVSRSHVHLIVQGRHVVRSSQCIPKTSKIYGFRFAFDDLLGRDNVCSRAMRRVVVGLAPSNFDVSDQALSQGPFWGVDSHGSILESRLDLVQSILTNGHDIVAISRARRRSTLGREVETTQSRWIASSMNASSSRNENDPDSSLSGLNPGLRQIFSVIVDNITNTITFFRGGDKVGSISRNVLSSYTLQPLAICYQPGFILAITGMSCDPLSTLRDYRETFSRFKIDRLKGREAAILEQRSRLISNQRLTDEVKNALHAIFSWYIEDDKLSNDDVESLRLRATTAARLWYRCGLKLSQLEASLLSERNQMTGFCEPNLCVSFEDFLNAVETVVLDDNNSGMDLESVEIGDQVELAEENEWYCGKAVNSYLKLGDRGTVVDIRSVGSSRSIRVLSSDGRCSWYEQQLLYSDRSGLIESKSVYFLTSLLRRHGINPKTFESRIGTRLSDSSWNIGDFVTLYSNKCNQPDSSMIGRVYSSYLLPLRSDRLTARSSMPHVGVEFFDSTFSREGGLANVSTQRISSGITAPMTATFSPTNLKHVFPKHGLFKTNNQLPSNEDIFWEKDSDPLNDFFFTGGSLQTMLSDVIRFDPSAIMSLHDLLRTDPLLIPKLCSRGLLNALLAAVDGVEIKILGAMDRRNSSAKIDASSLTQLMDIIVTTCETIFIGNKVEAKETDDNELVGSESVIISGSESVREKFSITELNLHNCATFRSDSVQSRSLIERGLLLNDSSWVGKAIGQSKRNTLSVSGVVKSTRDSDGSSLLYIAISFGCSVEIIKSLIKVGCQVTEREVRIAAVYNQPEILKLLMRYTSFTEGSAYMHSCTLPVKEILLQAFERFKQEEATLQSLGYSFAGQIFCKLLQLLSSVRSYSREPAVSVYFAQCSKILTDALFGKFCSHVRTNNAPSSTFYKIRSSDKAASLFQILPTALITESLLSRIESARKETLIQTCLCLMESFLWTKDERENYVGLTLASYFFTNGPEVSKSDIDRYGFRQLLECQLHRANLKCRERNDSVSARRLVLCPQGHVASFHITNKSSFRCDLCEKAIDIGKCMYGCRTCDWDTCDACFQDVALDIEWDIFKNMSSRCNQDFNCRYPQSATEESCDDELYTILKGISKLDHNSVRQLSKLMQIPGKVTLSSFLRWVVPILYSSVIMNLQTRNHPPSSNILSDISPKRKKLRLSSPVVEVNNSDFITVILEALVLDSRRLASVSNSADRPYDGGENIVKNMEDDDDPLKVLPLKSGFVPLPPLLRAMHTILTFYENFAVTKNQRLGQPDLETLTIPFCLECVSINQIHHPIKDVFTLSAEPTVPISDVKEQVIRNITPLNIKYSNYCRSLACQRAIILESSANSSNTEPKWKLARVLSYDEADGSHTVQYAIEKLVNLEPPSLEKLEFHCENVSVILSMCNYYLIRQGQEWDELLSDAQSECVMGNSSSGSSQFKVGILKRSWSAISLVEENTSIDISSTLNTIRGEQLLQGKRVGKKYISAVLQQCILVVPPKISVDISLCDDSPTVSIDSFGDRTLFECLQILSKREQCLQVKESMDKKQIRLLYSVRWIPSSTIAAQTLDELNLHSHDRHNSSSKQNNDSFWNEFEGDKDACLKIMHLLSIFSSYAKRYQSHEDSGENFKTAFSYFFEAETLTQKLLDQLNDPLAVVCGVMPQWCLICPRYFPFIFSYNARRLLLERGLFGVSRSTLHEQEAKVSVAYLRAQMLRLRSRAVELVAEAFSGGASDPAALQLQADELYGLEEAIKSKINSVFAAQRWQERVLTRARAIVCRERLLSDAATVMENYVRNNRAKMRRLEIRFSGESGFDASDEEAGVTRGFYADVAELLLSCDPCRSGNLCIKNFKTATCSVRDNILLPDVNSTVIPLWISDMDPSHQVVIPTPRANPYSTPGVYPRPLSPDHPSIEQVQQCFKLMGRLFAAAMRDKFLFPLPLSTAFLKLVQGGLKTSKNATSNSKQSDPYNFNEDFIYYERFALDSTDLPRPGFIGGEIFAADQLCESLQNLTMIEHVLSKDEVEKRKREIASDPSFAKRFMGKKFEASFEECFDGKCFVDPFDPAQDETSTPLCPMGHTIPVTVDNVCEWVRLAKKFTLHDGIIVQVLAFRDGVDDFFPVEALQLFTAEELQRDVCGGGDNVDNWNEKTIRSLFKLDAYGSADTVEEIGNDNGWSRRFNKSSSTILYLIKALQEAKSTTRRQFLSFVTSLPLRTPGKIEVVPITGPTGELLPVSECCLPRANTCGRRLYLPSFKNYDEFKRIFLAVLSEECKFKGFFEWRGQ